MRVTVCLVLLAWGSVTLDAQNQAAGPLKNPVPPAAKSIAAGGQLFQRYCAPCHSDTGKGNGPLSPRNVQPPDLTDAAWTHGGTDAEIFTNIREGIGPKFDMKSMKSRMTDTEIWHVVNYIRSLGPKP
jgi:mono/diheme cytochrome c family protein